MADINKRMFIFLCVVMAVLSTALCFVPFLTAFVTAKETTIHPVVDTYINAYEPNTNYGASYDFAIWYWSPTRKYIAFLKFDLSSIPTEATITRAVFHAHLSRKGGGKTAQVGVHFVSDNTWNEYEITWNNAPSYRIDPTYVNNTVAFEEVWYSWIVTSAVSEALPKRILSFALVSEVESNIDRFSSRESMNKPILQIEYIVPPTYSRIYLDYREPHNFTGVYCTDFVNDTERCILRFKLIMHDAEYTPYMTIVFPNCTMVERDLSVGDVIEIDYENCNATMRYAEYFTLVYYDGPANSVKVNGVEIPEFPTWPLLLLTFIVLSAVIILLKKRPWSGAEFFGGCRWKKT